LCVEGLVFELDLSLVLGTVAAAAVDPAS
jgi:hypothetical protein